MPISIWWKPQNSLKIPSLDTDAVATHFLYKNVCFCREMMMIHEVQRNVILHGLLNKENIMMLPCSNSKEWKKK